jgi:hypothetical protein
MRRTGMMLVILLGCVPVLGQAPVGPSTALLRGARFGLAVEYGQSDTDLTFLADGGLEESFDYRTIFANFTAPLTSRWEFFVRVGGAQAETAGFDGDWNLSWGLGTRYTVLKWNDLSWGILGQFTNLVSQFDTMGVFDVNEGPVRETDELNVVEYVFATGPTWRHGGLSLYGGLLVRLADGNFEIIAERFGDRFDIDAQWEVGGYVGGTVTLFQRDPARTPWFSRADLTAEGRFTDDSTGFSVSLLLPFGGEY